MTTYILNGGQVIVDYLVREKVPYVFGFCGHGNIGLLDALFERSSDIKTISGPLQWPDQDRHDQAPCADCDCAALVTHS